MSRNIGASLGGGLEPSGDSCGFRGLLLRVRLAVRGVRQAMSAALDFLRRLAVRVTR